MDVNEKNKKNEKSKSPKKINSLTKIKNRKSIDVKNSSFLRNLSFFPKNVNEFRHIIDDVNCSTSDVEYMLQLRRYKKISNINKNIQGNTPSFYDEDFRKYKNKLSKKTEDKILLKTNIGNFKHIFSDRSKYAINDTQYKFETTLRENQLYNLKNIIKNSRNNSNKNINNNIKNKFRWDSTTIPRSKSLFDTFLPPILNRSREIFGRLEDKIGRPILQKNKDGYINGEKVKSRVFDYNKNIALRYPSEHNPGSRYTNDYGTQNVGAIKHLLNYDNRTMTSSWSTYLRGPKKIKFLPEETKKREKRLRDISNEKSYPKN